MSRGISEPRVARTSPAKLAGPPRALHLRAQMSPAKLAGPPRALHLRAQSCGDASGETDRTNSRAVPPSPELRECVKPNWPDHLSSGHIRTQSCEDVSSETGRTTRMSVSAGLLGRTSFYRNMAPVSTAAWGSAVKEGVRTGTEGGHERGGTDRRGGRKERRHFQLGFPGCAMLLMVCMIMT